MTQVYFEVDVWRYDTDRGVMDCPPFVKTIGDVHAYFGDIPHEIVGNVPQTLRSERRPKMADYARRRTLADDGFIEYLAYEEGDSEELEAARAERRLATSIRESKARRQKSAGANRRSVIPLYHCYDANGARVASYNTLREASEAIGRDRYSVGHALKDMKRTSGGYRWVKAEIPPRSIGPLQVWKKAGPKGPVRVPCSSYDHEGRRIATWGSIKEAALALGVSPGGIGNALRSPASLVRGRRFRKGDAESIEPYVKPIHETHRMLVSSYDAQGKRVATYLSYREAAEKVGISKSTIAVAVRGVQYLVRGLRWRKGEEETIEPIEDGRKDRKKND